MDPVLQRAMIELSNNSSLTQQASDILSNFLSTIEPGQAHVIKDWFQHAVRETQTKISNAKNKPKFFY